MNASGSSDLGDLLTADDVRMLVDLGFIALSAGLNGEARAIFAGVAAARPHGEAGPLGTAMVHLAEGEIDPAVAILRRLPPTDAALTYLGIALLRRGDGGEARRILSDVAETAAGTPFAALAAEALAS